MKNEERVAVAMGSFSDFEDMGPCFSELKDLGIGFVARVVSAHRNPKDAKTWIREREHAGAEVFIAGAGMAAHLAGFIAAYSALPVIGVPLPRGELGGVDALLSSLQMPPGVPVAVMAIGKPGAKNAAIFTAQILAIKDKPLKERLLAKHADMEKKLLLANEELEKRLKS